MTISFKFYEIYLERTIDYLLTNPPEKFNTFQELKFDFRAFDI
jgi:hypothetical protein